MGLSINKIDSNFLDRNKIDAHKIKEDYGAFPLSRYDLYVEREKNQENVTIRNKKGELFADTGMTRSELVNAYSNSKDKGGKWNA